MDLFCLNNNSLLLATSPTSSSPRKASVVVAASSSSDLVPLSRLPSSIISRRSNTSNSSANSSENESLDGTIARKNKIPFSSSLTTSASVNKNKYMSTWDSDFSDDNFAQHNITNSGANFIRVPAKTSNRPRTFDSQRYINEKLLQSSL